MSRWYHLQDSVARIADDLLHSYQSHEIVVKCRRISRFSDNVIARINIYTDTNDVRQCYCKTKIVIKNDEQIALFRSLLQATCDSLDAIEREDNCSTPSIPECEEGPDSTRFSGSQVTQTGPPVLSSALSPLLPSSLVAEPGSPLPGPVVYSSPASPTPVPSSVRTVAPLSPEFQFLAYSSSLASRHGPSSAETIVIDDTDVEETFV